MKRILATFLIVITGFSSLYPKDSGVIIRTTGQEIYETAPGANIMTAFLVMNQTSENIEFLSEVQLPPDWKLIARESPFAVDAASSDMRLISFHVPKETPAGEYEVTYAVASRRLLSVGDRYSIRVLVLPVKRLRIASLDAPAFVIAGESYTLPFQVINESNVDGTVSLRFVDSPEYGWTADSTTFRLRPGGSRVCSVRVRTDAAIVSMLNHFVTVRAVLADDSTAFGEMRSVVKVVPAGRMKADRYNRFPVSLGVSYAAQKDGYTGSGLQFEASGAGPLARDRKDLLRFLFRGPDTYLRDLYTYGMHEQYSIGYRNGPVQLDAGDKSYTLSRLTEQSRWGRGAEVRIQAAGWTGGAFASRALYFWSGSVRSESAGYLRRDFGKKGDLGLNLLHKSSPGLTADMFSAQGSLHLNALADLRIEAAGSVVDGRIRPAVDAGLSGRLRNLLYSGFWIEAGSKYPGYFTNTRIQAFGLGYRIGTKLRVDCNLNRQKKEYDVETHRVVAPLISSSSAGLAYEWNRDTRFSLTRAQQTSRDRYFQPLFDYRETAYRFGADRSFSRLTLSGTAETGETDNRLTGRRAGMVRVTGTAHYHPSDGNNLGAFFSYDDDRRYSDRRMRRWTVGLDLRARPMRNTDLQLSCQNQFSPESYFEDRNLLEFSLSQRIGATQELSLRCRKVLMHNSVDHAEIAFKADYRIALNVPAGRNRAIGSVRGVLRDLESGRPVMRAVVRLNEYMAVTDDQGRYRFESLPPGGEYYLSLDKSTVGIDKVLAQATPLRVDVAGGEEKDIDLDIIRGAEVRGRVVVYTVVNDSSDHFKADKMAQYLNDYYVAGSSQKRAIGSDVTVTNGKIKMVPDYGIGNVLVELKKDGEVIRRLTDDDGSFIIDGLRPGPWSLTVYDYNLPEMHRIEAPSRAIDLKPGDTENLMVKVLPIRRQIQFVQREGAVLEAKGL
jgi:hypothetical protein